MHRTLLVFIGVAVLLFTCVRSDSTYAAGFKSEDELVDETRANVEKHMNDKRQAPPKPVPVVEDKPAVMELPAVTEDLSPTLPGSTPEE